MSIHRACPCCPATSDIDKYLLFRIAMEAADLDSQLQATSFGLVPRGAAEASAPRYSAASMQSIAEGGPANDHPALGVANAALEQFIPMVATGELTSTEALQAAHDLYIEKPRPRVSSAEKGFCNCLTGGRVFAEAHVHQTIT